MPEQDRLTVILTTGQLPCADGANLSMDRFARHLSSINVTAQTAKGSYQALLPMVHHNLVHDVREIILDSTLGAVGNHQRSRPYPFRTKQRLGCFKPRSLYHDIGTFKTALPIICHSDGFAEFV